jgi:hypothetical protein
MAPFEAMALRAVVEKTRTRLTHAFLSAKGAASQTAQQLASQRAA